VWYSVIGVSHCGGGQKEVFGWQALPVLPQGQRGQAGLQGLHARQPHPQISLCSRPGQCCTCAGSNAALGVHVSPAAALLLQLQLEEGEPELRRQLRAARLAAHVPPAATFHLLLLLLPQGRRGSPSCAASCGPHALQSARARWTRQLQRCRQRRRRWRGKRCVALRSRGGWCC